MSVRDDLHALWAELVQTTRGYKQMPQPLVAGTHWYNAKALYDRLDAELAPTLQATITGIAIQGGTLTAVAA